jgi:hypothetical protein
MLLSENKKKEAFEHFEWVRDNGRTETPERRRFFLESSFSCHNVPAR